MPIPTGSLNIDAITGIGGIPRYYFSEVFGPPASGKSTLCINIAREAEKLGIKVIYIDIEGTFSKKYAADAMVKRGSLIIVKGGSTESSFKIIEGLMTHSWLAKQEGKEWEEYLFILDSVGMLATERLLNKDIGDVTMGLNASVLNQNIVRLNGNLLSKRNATFLSVNHVHTQIGVSAPSPHMIPKITTGGERLKFACSLRLDIKRSNTIKSGTAGVPDIGFKMKVKVFKNKVGAPNGVVEADYYYATGFDIQGEIFDEALRLGIIIRETSVTYSLYDIKYKGAYNVKDVIRNDDELYQKLLIDIKEHQTEGYNFGVKDITDEEISINVNDETKYNDDEFNTTFKASENEIENIKLPEIISDESNNIESSDEPKEEINKLEV